jgi:phosphoribosylamine--glycine ligase
VKILFVSKTGDGFWHAAVLAQHHDLTLVLGNDKYKDTLAGIVPPPVDHIGHPADYDLIIFDDSSNGDVADGLKEHTPVIGSSKLADKLEHDRLFGIEFMEKAGIQVPPYETFDDTGAAIDWLHKTKKRTVLKPFGERADSAATYVSKSPEDMEQFLEALEKHGQVKKFLLQEFVDGTEISTEGWFNGEDFFAVNHTLEEKKFMSGGIGPNTGCSGNVLWMPDHHSAVYKQGLRRAASLLGAAGFTGPIDLNTIVTEDGVFGLEWTPRFGYEGTCNLMAALPLEFGEFMCAIAAGKTPKIESSRYNFVASIRVTVPPYPNDSKPEKYAGTPVKGVDLEDLEHFYLNDVRIKKGTEDELETLGLDGLIGAPMGAGNTIREAFGEVEKAIERLEVPNLQWRNDVGECCERRYNTLLKQGWLIETAATVSA